MRASNRPLAYYIVRDVAQEGVEYGRKRSSRNGLDEGVEPTEEEIKAAEQEVQ